MKITDSNKYFNTKLFLFLQNCGPLTLHKAFLVMTTIQIITDFGFVVEDCWLHLLSPGLFKCKNMCLSIFVSKPDVIHRSGQGRPRGQNF